MTTHGAKKTASVIGVTTSMGVTSTGATAVSRKGSEGNAVTILGMIENAKTGKNKGSAQTASGETT